MIKIYKETDRETLQNAMNDFEKSIQTKTGKFGEFKHTVIPLLTETGSFYKVIYTGYTQYVAPFDLEHPKLQLQKQGKKKKKKPKKEEPKSIFEEPRTGEQEVKW